MKLHELGLATEKPIVEFAPANQSGLVRVDDFTLQTYQLRDALLDRLKAITSVSSPEENEAATQQVQSAHDLSAEIEASRKRWIKPFMDEIKRANELAANMVKEVDANKERINRLCGDWFSLEQAKARSAKIALSQTQSELTRQHHEARAQAQSHDDLDFADMDHQLRMDQIAKEAPAPIAPANGQRIKEDWEVTILDVQLAYLKHPKLFKDPEPRLPAIKAALDAGMVLEGVAAKRVVVSKVIKTRQEKAIEI